GTGTPFLLRSRLRCLARERGEYDQPSRDSRTNAFRRVLSPRGGSRGKRRQYGGGCSRDDGRDGCVHPWNETAGRISPEVEGRRISVVGTATDRAGRAGLGTRSR